MADERLTNRTTLRPDVPDDDAALLAQCDVDTYRASGPGGQNRNKVESAVRLRHRPTGLSVIAEESRSQAENRVRGLRRLRKAIALRLRRAVADEEIDAAIRACVDKNGRLRLGVRDRRYLAAAATALDVLMVAKGSVGDAALRLGLTTGNLSSFLTADEELMTEANRIRAGFGVRLLRH